MASDKRYQNFIINNHLLSTYQKNLLILSNVIFSKLIIWVYLIRYSYKTKNLLHLIYGGINILADRQTSCLMLFILHFSTLFTFFFLVTCYLTRIKCSMFENQTKKTDLKVYKLVVRRNKL